MTKESKALDATLYAVTVYVTKEQFNQKLKPYRPLGAAHSYVLKEDR